jgi:hypothetical protein
VGKLLELAKIKERTPATDVQELACDIADGRFESAAALCKDSEGYWHFRCTAGIDKVSLIGMLDFIKMQIYESMESS